jgi:hypothetical protein
LKKCPFFINDELGASLRHLKSTTFNTIIFTRNLSI